MLQTIPSIEALADAFACSPRIGSEHPQRGILKYDVEYESPHERVGLSVLPLAQEVTVSIVLKNPSRILRLALENVSEIRVDRDEDGERIKINFATDEVQPLSVTLKPNLFLIWGNQHDSPDRHPPWERD